MGDTSKEDRPTSVETEVSDVEGEPKKLKYPRAIPFIISNEFCERFNYYGMRTVLVLYLTRKLDFDDDTATVLYHTFTTLVYFMCVIGAIIADSWLGKFRTILYLSIVYTIGSGCIALGAIPTWDLNARAMTIAGLLLIAFGSGGIKPCVAAFGGEQFKLPEQAKYLALFFSMFYFAVNSGSFVSTMVTPILREDVKCFDDDDCFPLAFGVPGLLMVVSIIIFIIGKPLYKISAPSGNMFVKVSKCIWTAIRTRSKEKSVNPREHWLDYSEKRWGRQLVDETRILLNVLRLYIPLPVFWALFDQQGSRWTFQATRMDGDLGFWTIKPDQMQVINPLLILVFIPLYEVAFYPLLSMVGIRRPLQKLTLGGIFAGLAFVISTIVEIQLESTYAVIPEAGEGQLRIFNGMNCDYRVQTTIPEHTDFILKRMSMFEEKYLSVNGKASYTFTLSSSDPGPDCSLQLEGIFELEEEKQLSYFINKRGNVIGTLRYEDDTDKSSKGYPIYRVLGNTATNRTVVFRDVDNSKPFDRHTNGSFVYDLVESYPSDYEISVDGELALTYTMRLGGVYAFIVTDVDNNRRIVEPIIVTEPNSINMLWLIPQYVVMTLGEVMYSITGLEFSFTQAPESMKSVLQGCWQLTVAVGNLIVVIVAEAKIFDAQKWEFVLFAGLMFVDMGLFSILAWRYKEIPLKKYEEDDANATLSVEQKEDNGFDNPAFKKQFDE
ncbi:peptide transporter family 1-like [Anopheles ziemanni]|uniref:peptide transporter family 1-like n=1 Tax=Anopheles coustani TaxID=139045 RepID=UPI002658AB77|nr:peptide transporter family 1-like [Anopheles coustani]XP_058176962.1 peptide transporter family 1-like [Anopheles ziemanni]